MTKTIGQQLRDAHEENAALRRDVIKLQAFKDFVHNQLTEADVPLAPDPEGTKAHGCRIGGRLDWLFRYWAVVGKAP